jgi:hypothetical protein
MSIATYTSHELRQLIKADSPHVEIGTSLNADGKYALATRESWELEILPAYKRWMIANRLWLWRKAHDCDDKADCLKVFSQRCFVEAKIKGGAEGFAVWRVWYITKLGEAHAINRALTDGGNGFIYIEPQTAKLVTLTPKEEQSKWLEY